MAWEVPDHRADKTHMGDRINLGKDRGNKIRMGGKVKDNRHLIVVLDKVSSHRKERRIIP